VNTQEARDALRALAGYDRMAPVYQEGFNAAMSALEEAVIQDIEKPLDSSMQVSDPMDMWSEVTDAIARIRGSREEIT